MRKKKKQVAVRFKRPWQGRQVGQVDRGLGAGVCETLVQNNIAEYHYEKRQQHRQEVERGPNE